MCIWHVKEFEYDYIFVDLFINDWQLTLTGHSGEPKGVPAWGVRFPSAHPDSNSFGAVEFKRLLLNTFVEKKLEQHAHMKYLPYKEDSILEYGISMAYFKKNNIIMEIILCIISTKMNSMTESHLWSFFLTYLNINHKQDHSI